jgi:hypothetical protein
MMGLLRNGISTPFPAVQSCAGVQRRNLLIAMFYDSCRV